MTMWNTFWDVIISEDPVYMKLRPEPGTLNPWIHCEVSKDANASKASGELCSVPLRVSLTDTIFEAEATALPMVPEMPTHQPCPW